MWMSEARVTAAYSRMRVSSSAADRSATERCCWTTLSVSSATARSSISRGLPPDRRGPRGGAPLGGLGALDLVDPLPVPRVPHGDVEPVVLELEREQHVLAGVLLAQERERLRLDVAHAEVDEPDAPQLGDVAEDEVERHAPALDHRPLERDAQPGGHLLGQIGRAHV